MNAIKDELNSDFVMIVMILPYCHVRVYNRFDLM